MAITKILLDAWYNKRRRWLTLALLPVAGLFRCLIALRRRYYHRKAFAKLPLPVVVVGNINLGGSGKSPLLIALTDLLTKRSLRAGVISRGYGGRAPHYPYSVNANSDTRLAGDEPVMIARRARCPVVVDASRREAAQHLVDSGNCDIILSDDGLQHYALRRDLEIVVVDGQRLLGNGQLLPAGPLREPSGRLREVDWVVINGRIGPELRSRLCREWKIERLYQMELRPRSWRRVSDGKSFSLEDFPWGEEPVHAVAGIGNPERFFASLQELGVPIIPHAFADHHEFSRDDLDFSDERPVLMTEKDAVKCQALIGDADPDRFWYLQVDAELEPEFCESFLARVEALTQRRNSDSDQLSADSSNSGK